MSLRFQHAFKVALAMVITYGIAMGMNWDKPFWAGMSVAFCSMATAGDSVRKGVLRVVGTFFSGIVTIVMIAMFGQDRWAFLGVMTMFLALCTYRHSGGSRYADIWFNTGFNLPLLAMLGEGLALNSFEMIELRVLETGLGMVVYSLVAVLLWPRRGGEDFENNVRSVLNAQHDFLVASFTRATAAQEQPLRVQLAAIQTKLGSQLEGVIYDNDQIMEARYAWRRIIGQMATLTEALDRGQQTLRDLQGANLQSLFIDLASIRVELKDRYAGMSALLAGTSEGHRPASIDLGIDMDEVAKLTHLQRAALMLFRDQLLEIDKQSAAIVSTLYEIHTGSQAQPAAHQQDGKSAVILDPDRFAAAVRQTTVLWMLILLVIYIPSFPNPVGTLVMANAFAMVLGAAPFVPARVLFWPMVLGALFAGAVYMFVMPHLSGFGELGTMLFVTTFLIGYVFHQPKAVVAKSIGILALIIIIGAENQQHYSFLYFANWMFALPVFVLILMAAWRFPISFRAEDRFPVLLKRFLCSAEYLLSTNIRLGSPWLKWLRAFHSHEITVLPQRLRVWKDFLPKSVLGDTTKPQLESMINEMLKLSDLIRTLEKIQPAEFSEAQYKVFADIQSWHEKVHHVFSHLSEMPFRLNEQDVERFESSLKRIEQHAENAVDQIDDSAISPEERKHIYQLLGAYRGVSRALVELTRRIAPIDWGCLSEVRF
ncbi:FUSC family protein [Desulfopila aestuarii]|uniref:Uncharacterized membrane protein YccC n=1 Tax=Desulfopila aestuarii DSM 18488 TaxID=1121416 RepID=A0A1M7Y450_9BACT|nr:FUSC family protein [Desulfopila aestuarii]SHO47060.1 Uncharacterized membrane protein YccC [Desulfopila aestuarii DSM 18488]